MDGGPKFKMGRVT